jgi:hypothetical protein
MNSNKQLKELLQARASFHLANISNNELENNIKEKEKNILKLEEIKYIAKTFDLEINTTISCYIDGKFSSNTY